MAIHSKLTVVKLDTSLGVLTDISGYCKEATLPHEMDIKDVTTFGNSYRQWLAGFGNGTAKLSGPWTRAADQFFSPIYTAFVAGTLTSVSLEYGPEGSTTGCIKYSCELIMKNYEPGSKVDDPVEWSADFQITGALTVGTY